MAMYRYFACCVVVSLMCATAFANPPTVYTYPFVPVTNAESVIFLARFTIDPFDQTRLSPVTGVDVTDFQPGFDGTLSSPKVVSVASGPYGYEVLVATGPGEGTLWLNVRDDDSIITSDGEPLGGPGVGNGDYIGQWACTIDRTPPHVVSITALTPLTGGIYATYRVVISEPVSGVDVGDVATNDVNACPDVLHCGPPVSTIPGYWPVSPILKVNWVTNSEYDVVVGAPKSEMDLRLDVVDNDTIIDLARNALASASGDPDGTFRSGSTCHVDRSRPSLSLTRIGPAVTNAQRVEFEATSPYEEIQFSEPIPHVGWQPGDLSGVSLESMTCLDCDSEGWGHSWKLVVFTGTGSGGIVWIDNGPFFWSTNFTTCRQCTSCTPTCTGACTPMCYGGLLWNGAHDRAGWNAYSGRLDSVTIDRSMPSVVSITPVSTSSALRSAKAASPQFQVVFSEAVSGVDTADFAVAATGDMSFAKIAAVTQMNATSWLVTTDAGNGSRGLLSVRVADDDSIVDAVGNPLGGPGAGNGAFNAGEPIVMGRPPVVAKVTLLDRNPARPLDVVRFAFDFSSRVTSVSGDDFRIFEHGVTRSTIAGVEPGETPTQWIVSVPLAQLSTEVAVSLADDDSIVDDYGLPLGGVGAGNGDYLSPAYVVGVDPIPALDPMLLAILAIALACAGGIFMRR